MPTPNRAAQLGTAETNSDNVTPVGASPKSERTHSISRSIFECRLQYRITDWDCITPAIGGGPIAAPAAVIAISTGTRSSPATHTSMRGSDVLIPAAVPAAA